MRVLHLSQYYPPEAGAVQVRADVIDRYLVAQGHRVTTVAEVPNHPGGVIWPAYRRRLFTFANERGVDVLRIWVKTSAEKTAFNRIAFYFSYMCGAIVAGLVLVRRYDVIFANSPPLFVAVGGAVLSWLTRKPFVMEVQDLWPEAAEALGALRSRRGLELGHRLARFCYRRARKIIAVSRGIYTVLQAKLPTAKLALYPNGSNVDLFRPSPEGATRVRRDLRLEGRFLVVYGGILGLAQGLEVILDTAALLREEQHIHFLIVGDGPRRAALLERHAELGLSNVTFVGGQPLERMPDYLSAANVCLVPLRRLGLFKGVLPTKMFDAWACETPTVVGVEGEARTLAEEVGAGVYVEPENPRALADLLLELSDRPDRLQPMGPAGRRAVLARYSLQAAAQSVEATLDEVVTEGMRTRRRSS